MQEKDNALISVLFRVKILTSWFSEMIHKAQNEPNEYGDGHFSVTKTLILEEGKIFAYGYRSFVL